MFPKYISNTACILIIIGITAFSETVATMKLSYNHQALQTKLSYNIIENYLDDCYVVKGRKQATNTFTDTPTKVPVIGMNFEKSDITRMQRHFSGTTPYGLMIKHQRQCIVYYMSLAGFSENSTNGLLEIFQMKAQELMATYSYIIITEFETAEIGESFFLSPKLHKFQHRMFVKPSIEDDNRRISAFQLNLFCYFCSNGNPEIKKNGIYRNVQEIKRFDHIFPDMTKNFNGKTLRVVVPPAPPLVFLLPSKTNPGTNEIHGQHSNILKSIAHHLNFSYSLYKSPDGLTGIRLPNGTWNGIMGEILYGRADIGLSIATSYARYQICDITTPVFHAFLVLVSTKPKPIFEWQAIFYPFKVNCWIAFIVSTIITFFLSKWIHNTSIKYEVPLTMRGRGKGEILSKLRAEFLTNFKSFYIIVGNLLEQGPPFDFNSMPSRIFVTFWMFFAMIITTAYRSKLFLFLTFPTVEVPPGTFLELIASTYKFGMKHIGGIAFIFITKSPLAYVRNIGERMQVYNDKYSCLDRTFKDKFTCIIYKPYIDYMKEIRYWKLRHNFYVSDFVSPPVGSSWGLPKNAPWFPVFDKASFPVFEMGLARKYLHDYQVSVATVLRANVKGANSTQDLFDLNTNFKNDDDAGPKPLIMANLYAAFFILMFGIGIGAILVATEIARKYKYNKTISKRQRKLKIHLRRKLRQKKKELQIPKGKRLSLRQVVKVIRPNINVILELENRQKKDRILSTIATFRDIQHKYYH